MRSPRKITPAKLAAATTAAVAIAGLGAGTASASTAPSAHQSHQAHQAHQAHLDHVAHLQHVAHQKKQDTQSSDQAGSSQVSAQQTSSTSGPSAHEAHQAHQAHKKHAQAAKSSGSSSKSSSKSSDGWVRPVEDNGLSAGFGGSGSQWSNGHTGQDFTASTGTSVKAAAAGTVVKSGSGGAGDGAAYGNAVVIKHDDGHYTQYAHLSSIQVSEGSKVKAGQQIALSGATGNVTGPHLHFEVRTSPDYGSAVDPVQFLRSHGVQV